MIPLGKTIAPVIVHLTGGRRTEVLPFVAPPTPATVPVATKRQVQQGERYPAVAACGPRLRSLLGGPGRGQSTPAVISVSAFRKASMSSSVLKAPGLSRIVPSGNVPRLRWT